MPYVEDRLVHGADAHIFEPPGWIDDYAASSSTRPHISARLRLPTAALSSDYPHAEGGRNPLKRFDESMQGCTDEQQSKFYSGNFAGLMGPTLDRDGVGAAGGGADRGRR